MNKLNIDGKLVVISQTGAEEFIGIAPEGPAVVIGPMTEAYNLAAVHHSGECLTCPTYFCTHCAREAMLGVDLANPWGER